ncbi:MAG: response regulator transcription factor [Nitrospirota bacterium]
MIKVLIADDHPLFREGIKRMLSETSDMVVADEASNGQEVLNIVKKNDFDVIMLDISMPGRSGLDIIKQLKCDRPDLHILILSMHSEEEYAERALKAGAAGYLVKKTTPDELVTAIRKVSMGKKYVSSSLAERLACQIGKNFKKMPHESLSDREYEVMCMIASGKRIKEIAEELSLSRKTITTHRTHILGKMGLKNNSQLTHYAIQNQLVN